MDILDAIAIVKAGKIERKIQPTHATVMDLIRAGMTIQDIRAQAKTKGLRIERTINDFIIHG